MQVVTRKNRIPQEPAKQARPDAQPEATKVDVTQPDDLENMYLNPEFGSAADRLIEAIKHQIVQVDSQPYNRRDVLRIANKILETRI